MKVRAIILLTMTFIVRGLRRGPHHPHGQQPVDSKHHHYQPKTAESLTRQSDILHDTKHLEEDAKLSEETLAKMSPERLELYYFLAHDFDKNAMLDGLELLKAVYHTIDHNADGDDDEGVVNAEQEHVHDLEKFVELVDKTLTLDDTNDDGFISYSEYRAARSNRNLTDKIPIVLAAQPHQ